MLVKRQDGGLVAIKMNILPDEPIVESLSSLDNRMRSRKDRPAVRFKRGTVRVVLDVSDIRCPWIEALRHIFLRELREGASFEAEIFHDFVDAPDLSCCHAIRSKNLDFETRNVRPIVSNM
jgi:hypothetical protein